MRLKEKILRLISTLLVITLTLIISCLSNLNRERAIELAYQSVSELSLGRAKRKTGNPAGIKK